MSFASQECTGDGFVHDCVQGPVALSRQLVLNTACLEQESIAEGEFAVVDTVNKTMPPSFISLLIESESSSTPTFICI